MKKIFFARKIFFLFSAAWEVFLVLPKIFQHTLRTSVVYLKTKTLRYLECSFFHLLLKFLGVMKGLSLYVEDRRPSFLFASSRQREIFHNKGSVLGRHNRNLFQVP